MAESSKLAYADRSEYLGDPDFVKIPWKGLTSRATPNRWPDHRPQPRSSCQRDQARPAPAVRKRPDHPLLGGGQGGQRRAVTYR